MSSVEPLFKKLGELVKSLKKAHEQAQEASKEAGGYDVQNQGKADKIEGVRKHKKLVRAKKMATEKRKAVSLPAGYRGEKQ